MSNLRAICRPHAVFSSMACCYRSMGRVLSVENHNCSLRPPSSSFFAVWFDRLGEQRKYEPQVRLNRQRRMVATKASNWTDSKSPYETLGKSFWRFILYIYYLWEVNLELFFFVFLQQVLGIVSEKLNEKGYLANKVFEVLCVCESFMPYVHRMLIQSLKTLA